MKFKYGQGGEVFEKLYLTVSRLVNYTRTEILAMPVTRFFSVLSTIKEDGSKWSGGG